FLFSFRLPRCLTLLPYTTLFRSAQPRSISPEASALPEANDLLDLGDGRLGDLARLFGAGGQGAVDLGRVGHQAAHLGGDIGHRRDRKSTRLNSSHVKISYAVFCL